MPEDFDHSATALLTAAVSASPLEPMRMLSGFLLSCVAPPELNPEPHAVSAAASPTAARAAPVLLNFMTVVPFDRDRRTWCRRLPPRRAPGDSTCARQAGG